MLVLPWETRAVFPCSPPPPPPFSVVYTNVGPWRVNNKGEVVRWGLLMLSAKFGVPVRLIPQGVCLWWHRCLLFAFCLFEMLGDEPPCFSPSVSVFVNRFPFRLPFWFVFWNWCWWCVEVIHSNTKCFLSVLWGNDRSFRVRKKKNLSAFQGIQLCHEDNQFLFLFNSSWQQRVIG